jgi:hypothetical protein
VGSDQGCTLTNLTPSLLASGAYCSFMVSVWVGYCTFMAPSWHLHSGFLLLHSLRIAPLLHLQVNCAISILLAWGTAVLLSSHGIGHCSAVVFPPALCTAVLLSSHGIVHCSAVVFSRHGALQCCCLGHSHFLACFS